MMQCMVGSCTGEESKAKSSQAPNHLLLPHLSFNIVFLSQDIETSKKKKTKLACKVSAQTICAKSLTEGLERVCQTIWYHKYSVFFIMALSQGELIFPQWLRKKVPIPHLVLSQGLRCTQGPGLAEWRSLLRLLDLVQLCT